jgi:hypothetical protein
MRVQEFVVSIVLPIDEECPALKEDDFMALLDFGGTTEPNMSLTFSQVRNATPKEEADFAFEDEEAPEEATPTLAEDLGGLS